MGKINDLMNYNYESKGTYKSKGTYIYKIFTEFMNLNSNLIDLDIAEQFLLSPKALLDDNIYDNNKFVDDRKKIEEDYENAKKTLEVLKNNKNYERGMSR